MLSVQLLLPALILPLIEKYDWKTSMLDQIKLAMNNLFENTSQAYTYLSGYSAAATNKGLSY